MVELMNVREQGDLNYARAHRRTLVGGFLAWVRGRCAWLRAFDEARRELGAENRRYLGRSTVERWPRGHFDRPDDRRKGEK